MTNSILKPSFSIYLSPNHETSKYCLNSLCRLLFNFLIPFHNLMNAIVHHQVIYETRLFDIFKFLLFLRYLDDGILLLP